MLMVKRSNGKLESKCISFTEDLAQDYSQPPQNPNTIYNECKKNNTFGKSDVGMTNMHQYALTTLGLEGRRGSYVASILTVVPITCSLDAALLLGCLSNSSVHDAGLRVILGSATGKASPGTVRNLTSCNMLARTTRASIIAKPGRQQRQIKTGTASQQASKN